LPYLAIPHLKSGKLNVIAVASKKRMTTLPNVPTMAEAGLMEAQGAEPVSNSPEEFKSFVKAEIDKWEQVIIKSGAKMD
jgi:tripartite-type tricarboxylate transporter receptor subunit TctC